MTVTYKGRQYVPFTHAAGSAKAVVAAKEGYQVLLHGLHLQAAGAVTITIEDSAGTNLSEAMSMVANGDLTLHMEPTGEPWAVTPDGTGLSILLGGAVGVQGIVIIEQVSTDN